jgi:hypothetical protein
MTKDEIDKIRWYANDLPYNKQEVSQLVDYINELLYYQSQLKELLNFSNQIILAQCLGFQVEEWSKRLERLGFYKDSEIK